MGGLAAVLERDGAPVDADIVRSLLAGLGRSGVGTREVVAAGPVAAGAIGAELAVAGTQTRGLLRLADGALFALDGRLDNRDELASRLSIDSREASTDLELAARAWERWGMECFAKLLGPFAIVVAEPSERRLVAARDPLGGRALFYSQARQRLTIASREVALLATPDADKTLDSARLARHFAADGGAGGSTFFRAVREVPPGATVEIGPTHLRQTIYWRPGEVGRRPFESERDCAEAYRELLRRAVRSRLRTATPAAVMLSGGLDSASLAALAAAEAADDALPQAVSWIFESLSECDERRLIEQTTRQLGIPWHRFAGDELWPLFDEAAFCTSPSSPEESPYRGLHQAAYQLAREHGCHVVLNGGAADTLYSRGRAWLLALARAGHWGEVVGDLRALPRSPSGPTIAGALRAAAAEARSRWLPRRPRSDRPWLTARARRLLEPSESAIGALGLGAGRMLDRLRSRGIGVESVHAEQAGVELRNPYRDLRLVEFMLGVPAQYLFRPGRPKLLARLALRDLLPAAVLAPRPPTLLTPLFRKGIDGPARRRIEEIVLDLGAAWPRWVEREYVRRALGTAQRGEAASYVLWQCTTFELWRKRHGFELE